VHVNKTKDKINYYNKKVFWCTIRCKSPEG